jgi:hypothetical protein
MDEECDGWLEHHPTVGRRRFCRRRNYRRSIGVTLGRNATDYRAPVCEPTAARIDGQGAGSRSARSKRRADQTQRLDAKPDAFADEGIHAVTSVARDMCRRGYPNWMLRD